MKVFVIFEFFKNMCMKIDYRIYNHIWWFCSIRQYNIYYYIEAFWYWLNYFYLFPITLFLDTIENSYIPRFKTCSPPLELCLPTSSFLDRINRLCIFFPSCFEWETIMDSGRQNHCANLLPPCFKMGKT